MQAHDDFIFHLDEPRAQFTSGRKRLRGWIAAREPLSALRVDARELQMEERPDVRRAFPNFAFCIGFIDELEARDLRNGALEVTFRSGSATRVVTEQLAPAARLSLVRQVVLHLRRRTALRRLKAAEDQRARWNAAVDVFLSETELAHGLDFRREEADRLIALFAKYFPEAFVLQIGAAEGLLGDPLVDALAKTRWRALLVEPVPHLCEALAARYRDRAEVRIEQAAVSTRDGDAPLYRLRTVAGESPEWFNHLATLDRDVLLQHGAAIPDLESLIVEERTPTVRLETLIARHQIESIDLLVVDTEGHDFEILRAFDFARFRPVVVMFEHQHLSAHDKAAAFTLLRAHRYSFREMPEGDAIAWRKL